MLTQMNMSANMHMRHESDADNFIGRSDTESDRRTFTRLSANCARFESAAFVFYGVKIL